MQSQDSRHTSWYELRTYPQERKANVVTKDGFLLEIIIPNPVPSFTMNNLLASAKGRKLLGERKWQKLMASTEV